MLGTTVVLEGENKEMAGSLALAGALVFVLAGAESRGRMIEVAGRCHTKGSDQSM